MIPHSSHGKLQTTLTEATSYISSRLDGRRPRIGLVLGSGLGSFADTLTDPVVIDYADIPHFSVSTVSGHAGRLIIGDKAGVTCLAMQGRVHPYEGYPAATVTFPVRTMILLGADTLIITNAAGSVEPSWNPGTLMLITDHLNLTGDNPLRGPNEERIGPRFPDMTDAYDPELRNIAVRVSERIGVPLEQGVYAGLSGPSYETPAEIRMIRVLGGHAVGMSTVFEVIAARHMGARVLGISCVTNLAAGLQGRPLHHGEVKEAADEARDRFQALLEGIIGELGPNLAGGPPIGSGSGEDEGDADWPDVGGTGVGGSL